MPWQGCSAQNRQHAYISESWVNLRESLQGTGDEANDMLQTELVVREFGR
jgi:hypothetical protein